MEILSDVRYPLLSATFDSLFQKLDRYVKDQLPNAKQKVHAQMESWMTRLPKIAAVLQHAEEGRVANQLVKLNLDDLRDLAYDMEDILEEFLIDAKRSELIAESEAGASKLKKGTPSMMNLFSYGVEPNSDINSRVNHLNVRLQHIENQMRTLGLINLTMKAEDKSGKVATEGLLESALLEDKVWGRDGDKEAILQRLLEDGGSLGQNFVIPIVGMGGVGKTTLARLIYNDKKLEGRFDLKAWVCFSDEFDVARMTRTILEQVTQGRWNLKSFSSLQERLKGMLSGRKFFLVLDDVSNKECGQWDVLKRPFMSGAPGSKIIVTTRNKDVGTVMRGDNAVYNLELLQDDACLPLFTWHALGKENFDADRGLQDVGEKLVKRCKRLPLALKTLGGVLRAKQHHDEWENILNSEIWSSSQDRTEILPALILSYNHLPSHLKPCFAYCALFPKNYEFDEKELVLLWMAEGLLQQQPHGKRQMAEEIGHQYFQELLSRSLFQQSSGDESRFVMHDLINDLAVDVAGEIYCNLERIMDDKKLEQACHLSFIPQYYEISKRFTILDKLKHLRTLLPLKAHSSHSGFYLSNIILHDLLPTLNRLRVLSLRNYQISKLPDSFENLKHIHYIDLSDTTIKCIPESVGSLIFLQTLLLLGCQMLTQLPTTIGNLIDLHHLDVTDTPSLKEMPSGIGNLENLLTMPKFIVGKASGLMRLFDLKNLLQLRGRLSILDLQNVLDVQDAREANLHKIHGLEQLVLEWSTSDNDRDGLVLEMQVLNRLKPHSNLKNLKISCYGGENFPNWVHDPLLFFNLSSMELSNCKRCTLLPSLGLLPVLKKLIIKGMEAIEAVGSEFYGGHSSFPSLEELVFENMLNWKEWTSPTRSGGKFPCLLKLVIENCPKLIGQLPSNLSSLEKLDVRSCNAMFLKSMGDLTSLAILRIEGISELTCLPTSMSLPSLKKLDIVNCNAELLKSMVDLTRLTDLRVEGISELTCLPESFTQSLIALQTLEITRCNDLSCLWKEGAEIEQSLFPFSLNHLSLVECGALQSLPNAMMVQMDGSSCSNTNILMLRLENLQISRCHSLKSFPRGKLPITLKYLRIEDCKGLESLPDTDGDNNSNLSLEIKNLPCLYSSKDCHQLPAFLKKFEVWNCDWLESFPEGMLQCCTELQSIFIFGCKKLKGLPTLNCVSNLFELEIVRCEVLDSLPELGLCTPNLKVLRIVGCQNLKSIPDGGLPTNLTELELDCENLKSVPNTMYQLTSLQFLRIPGGALTIGFGRDLQNLTALQELSIQRTLPLDIVLPSSLTYLGIFNEENLKSMPEWLFQNLGSLQELYIYDCPKLKSLPTEAFPPSLGALFIPRCRHLKRQRFEAKGDYWTLTHAIPRIVIDGDEVEEEEEDENCTDNEVLKEIPKETEWQAKRIHTVMDELSVLPESPNCPILIELNLQGSRALTALPPLFFVHMTVLQLLDLSHTSIKSLPVSLSKLVALKKLILRHCKLFRELTPQVGDLHNLEEINLDETQIVDLPKEIGKLSKLNLLRVSLYGYMNCEKSLQRDVLIHPGTIANLSELTNLSIDVNPDDKRWKAAVEIVVEEACNLKKLRCLVLYLPNFELLGKITETLMLQDFSFTVGQHKQRIISRVPKEVEAHFQKWNKCLKFVKGEGVPDHIKTVLLSSTALYLDRHATATSLSCFGVEEMQNLKFCILSECNEIQTVIDGGDSYETALLKLQFLHIYYMKNLVSIWRTRGYNQRCLSCLKFLALHMCPRLSVIFSRTLLINLNQLEVLIIEDCPEVTSIVSPTGEESVDHVLYLPRLKRVSLVCLPELDYISSGFQIAPLLKRIGFYGCPKLESLFTGEMSGENLEVIRGESEWWEKTKKSNESEWGKERLDRFESIFSHIDKDRDVMTQMKDTVLNNTHAIPRVKIDEEEEEEEEEDEDEDEDEEEDELMEVVDTPPLSNFDLQSNTSPFYSGSLPSPSELERNGFRTSDFPDSFPVDSTKTSRPGDPSLVDSPSTGGLDRSVACDGFGMRAEPVVLGVDATLTDDRDASRIPLASGDKSSAAVRLQKVYRSYRTRRRLADSAVVAEELWWQAIDFARLNHSTISFFDFLKPETVVSRWNRIKLNASKVGKGLSQDAKAQKLAFQHWIEAIDPRHRYGHNLHTYYEKWRESDSGQPFFHWLDIGDGKELDLKECPRSKLRQQCIKYLGPQERENYEYDIFEGKIIHKQTKDLLDTINGSKGSKWIFVMSSSHKLYAGEKKKGLFHHSSFLAGGATLAAGRLEADHGILKSISAYSGHYKPSDDILDSFLCFLKEKGVNIDEVKVQRATDDSDSYSDGKPDGGENAAEIPTFPDLCKLKIPTPTEEKSISAGSLEINPIETKTDYKRTLSGGLQSPKPEVPKKSILQRINSKKAAKSYQLGHQVSLKWTTGAGPRIGCVADYPVEVRQQALEFVNLSPRTPHSPLTPSDFRRMGGLASPSAQPTSNGCGCDAGGTSGI